MTKDELVAEVKRIVQVARSGDAEGSYVGYRGLFTQPDFIAQRPEDQRQVLKLLVLAKRSGTPSAGLLEAIRSALGPLTELVSRHQEPEDYEMLGVCHVLLGNDKSASGIFKEALSLERARSPQSDLCGRLMTRLSSI
jgi:hypothetical protein